MRQSQKNVIIKDPFNFQRSDAVVRIDPADYDLHTLGMESLLKVFTELIDHMPCRIQILFIINGQIFC